MISVIKYSIIIPHKDTPVLLQRCLDSIPIRDDVQVIVIDDNSDAEKVDFDNFPRWKGKNYEYYLTKEGKGAGYARNIGIERSTGKWLLFADSDDTFASEELNILLEKSKEDYDAICWPSDVTQINNSTDFYPYQQRAGHLLFDYTKIGQHTLTPCKDSNILYSLFEPWHKMCTRDLIDKYRIRYSEVISCNDALFSVRLAQHAKKTAVYSDVIYHYIKHSKSLSLVDDFSIIIQRTNELFRVQHVLQKVNKENIINSDLNYHLDVISKHSTKTALHECFIQMYTVSLLTGLRSLKKIYLHKKSKIFQDFKFYCKQCPLSPDENKTGIKRKILNIITALLTLAVMLYRRIYNLVVHKNYKYTLGIVAIAKNEGEYIQEWCAFHKAAGVDVIYLYDNESFDDMKEKLQPFIGSGFVKYHYVEGKGQQMKTYKKAFNKYKKECKYLTFIDCDEFLYTTDESKDLKHSIKSYFRHNPNTGGLAINWLMFGDNGHTTTPKGLCIESFTKRALPGKRATRVIKTILRSNNTRFIETPHSAIYKWGLAAYDQNGTLVPWAHNPILMYPSSPIRINHYFCKSIEQWIKRKGIGDGLTPNYIRPIEEFHETNNNDVEDIAILTYLPETKQILRNIQNTETA